MSILSVNLDDEIMHLGWRPQKLNQNGSTRTKKSDFCITEVKKHRRIIEKMCCTATILQISPSQSQPLRLIFGVQERTGFNFMGRVRGIR